MNIENSPVIKFLGKLVDKGFFWAIIIFSCLFAARLITILENRASLGRTPDDLVSTVAIDSLKTDSITKKILLDTRAALEGYRAMEQSFSILQSATGIIEVSLAFVVLGIPLFLFMLYLTMGKDINQIREVRDEVLGYKANILNDLQVVKMERASTNAAVLSSFREYNPIYAQIETKTIRQNLESTKPKKDYTDEEFFLIGGTYYIEKKYSEAITYYDKAKKMKPNEPLYSFHLGLTYDDEFSSRKFKKENIIDVRAKELANLAIGHYLEAVEGWDDQDQKEKKSLALSNLAFTNLELGKPRTPSGDLDSEEIKKAYDLFQKAEKDNPNDPYIIFGMAIAAHYLGLNKEAAEYFEEAEKREYSEKEKDYHKMYSRLQFRFMREEIYTIFKSPKPNRATK